MTLKIDESVGEAIRWEAARRGESPEAVAGRLLESAAAAVVAAWRDSRSSQQKRSPAQNPGSVRSVESLLAKAYGPARKGRSSRRPRA